MRIFLSHSSEQRAEAERLAIALRTRRHKVFLDVDDLPPSGDYQARIQSGIQRCDLFCFLISPQSVAVGRFTLSEIAFAKKRWPDPTGHVVPVREVRLSAGAGFIVAICGEIMTMPSLPKVPSSEKIFLNDKGQIEGLF